MAGIGNAEMGFLRLTGTHPRAASAKSTITMTGQVLIWKLFHKFALCPGGGKTGYPVLGAFRRNHQSMDG
jgi:hypothetical protein